MSFVGDCVEYNYGKFLVINVLDAHDAETNAELNVKLNAENTTQVSKIGIQKSYRGKTIYVNRSGLTKLAAKENFAAKMEFYSMKKPIIKNVNAEDQQKFNMLRSDTRRVDYLITRRVCVLSRPRDAAQWGYYGEIIKFTRAQVITSYYISRKPLSKISHNIKIDYRSQILVVVLGASEENYIIIDNKLKYLEIIMPACGVKLATSYVDLSQLNDVRYGEFILKLSSLRMIFTKSLSEIMQEINTIMGGLLGDDFKFRKFDLFKIIMDKLDEELAVKAMEPVKQNVEEPKQVVEEPVKPNATNDEIETCIDDTRIRELGKCHVFTCDKPIYPYTRRYAIYVNASKSYAYMCKEHGITQTDSKCRVCQDSKFFTFYLCKCGKLYQYCSMRCWLIQCSGMCECEICKDVN